MIEADKNHPRVRRQCDLLELSRSGHYRRGKAQPSARDIANERLQKRIDEIYTKCPFYGSRQMVRQLRREGRDVGRKRIQRLCVSWACKQFAPAPIPASRTLSIRCILTCCVMCRLPASIMSGRLTLPISLCRMVMSICAR